MGNIKVSKALYIKNENLGINSYYDIVNCAETSNSSLSTSQLYTDLDLPSSKKFLSYDPDNCSSTYKSYLCQDLLNDHTANASGSYNIALAGNAPKTTPAVKGSTLTKITGSYKDSTEYTIKAQKTKYGYFNIYIYNGDTLRNTFSKTNSLQIILIGGGAAGRRCKLEWYGGIYNGGGGGGGATMGVWLYLNPSKYMGTDLVTIGKFTVGYGGQLPDGYSVRQTVSWTFDKDLGYGDVATGTKLWIYPDGDTSSYLYYCAGGAPVENNRNVDKTASGGTCTCTKSTLNVGSIVTSKVIFQNKGGYGGAKVSKGEAVSLIVDAADIPIISKPSSNITLTVSQSSGSADNSDPMGPGWGGHSLYGKGDYMTSDTASILASSEQPGGGGMGDCITNWFTATFKMGTRGHNGQIRFIY